jgi:predicted porin
MKRLIIAAAAAAIAWPAWAADLGGNCCADLEERVAELEATTARKGNRKVSLEVSGHVNEAIFFHDVSDSARPNVSIIPNTNSVSRFRFRGATKLSSEWDAGFLIEVGVGGFEPGKGMGVSNRALKARHSALYVRSKALGTVWLGQTSVATDGAAQIDLSRSSIASSAMAFGPADEALLGESLDVFDGGRRDVVKWVSPTLGGFSLSASVSSEDAYDVALRYAGEFGSIRVAAAGGYRHDEGPLALSNDVETWVASGSVMELKSGVFLGGSYGHIKDFGVGDIKGWNVRGGVEKTVAAGIKATFFGQGGQYDLLDETADMYGAGLVLNFGAFDVYGNFQHLKAAGEDVNVGVVGAKIQF